MQPTLSRGRHIKPTVEQLEARCTPNATFTTKLVTEHADIVFNSNGSSFTSGVLNFDTQTINSPATTLLYGVPEALRTRPAGSQWDFVGVNAGQQFYVLPQLLNVEVLYLGFRNQSSTGLITPSNIVITLTDFKGPIGAHFSLYQTGTGDPSVLMTTTNDVTSADQLSINTGGHRHVNWAFTQRGIYQLTFRATASTSSGPIMGTATFTFAIDPMPPVNTVPSAQTTEENQAVVFSSTNGNGISVDFHDPIPTRLETKLTVTNGILTLATMAGLTVTGNNSSSVTLVGSEAAINAALNGLIYTPDQGFTGQATLTIRTSDRGNYGPTSAELFDQDTITITVNEDTTPNAPPVITAPMTESGPENQDIVFSTTNGNAITIDDPDARSGQLIVTLSVDQGGILTLATTTGLVNEMGNGTANVTFRGQLDAINAALNGLRFTPDDQFFGDVILTVNVNDQGNTGIGGPEMDEVTIAIEIEEVNDPPQITAPGPQEVRPTETLAFSTANGNAISVFDPDAGEEDIEVTLTVTAGTLSVSLTDDLTSIMGQDTDTLVLIGSQAAINASLQTLVYTAPDERTQVTLTIMADDLGNTGPGGPMTAMSTVSIRVAPDNLPPILSPPATAITSEDRPLVFSKANGNAISVDDADAFDGELQMTLTVSIGTLTITNLGGLTSVIGNGTSSVTITGTLTALNAALEGLTYRSPLDFFGSATLNVSVNDQGNTGLGGPLTDSGSIAITITPVNDPPIAGNAQYQATTGVPLVVPAPGLLAFAFDVDSPVLTVVLVEGPPVSAGTLDLRPDGSFTFTPAATFSGTVTFRYQVSDGEDLSNIATVTINVAAVRKNVIAVGAGAGGGPNAKLIDAATGQTILSVMAYDPLFAGGVRVAVGDVNGDGIPDLITAPGFGGGPHVKVFDGATGAELRSFMAYTPNFSGGLFIAAADVNGDGFVDIITGAGFGGGPHVQVFSGRDGSLIHSFFAFAPELTSGVIVAAGDIDGDGRADIIVGAGPGGGPHVVVFRGTDLALLHSFFAYNPAVTGGVHVAAGDVNGDGIADIITGSGNGSSHVQVFDGRTLALLRSQLVFPDVAPPLPSPQILSLLTTDRQPSSSPETPVPVGGVQVAFATNADNLPLIVAGAPAGQSPRLRAFGASGIELDLLAYDPAFLGGVFVG